MFVGTKAPAKPTDIVWQTFEILLVKHNVCKFAQTRARQTCFACDKQNVLVKQCLSWWPNAQACLTSKIQNVCETMSVRLAGAIEKSNCISELFTILCSLTCSLSDTQLG